jgi:hypothetical protein
LVVGSGCGGAGEGVLDGDRGFGGAVDVDGELAGVAGFSGLGIGNYNADGSFVVIFD